MRDLQSQDIIEEKILLVEAKEGNREFDKETQSQRFIRRFFTPLLIILVSSFSFGLGRFSKIIESQEPIRIEQIPTETVTKKVGAEGDIAGASTAVSSAVQGKYVASKSGTKYHLPWCSGAQRIKEENKIWFDTEEEAKKAGYAPAANCPGL